MAERIKGSSPLEEQEMGHTDALLLLMLLDKLGIRLS
jgi:hypothetical protein